MSNVFHEEVTQGDESSTWTASASAVGSLPTNEMPPESEKGSDAGHECRSMASGLVQSDVPTPVAKNETVQSEILSKANKEINKKKMPDNTHGLRFESKLLSLYCVRGLGAGYKFELSKEKEEEGGKLEDLIFRYEVNDTTPVGKHWRYRYLQAKHKVNEKEKITADHLLDYNPKGDFSLQKYFHSFYKIRARGDDIHDCIICTNINFNLDSLEKGGVELVSINDQQEDILEFGALENRTTARYKLKINNDDWHRKLKEEWSPVQLLVDELKDCATNNKTTQIRTGMLNSYHVALVEEYVIDCTKKKFHQDFVSDAGSLSEGAKELRQMVCELGENDSWKNWKFKLNNKFGESQSAVKNPLPRKITEEDVDNFFNKLVFVVDMPHEKKFEEIIETRDMSKYYQPDKCKDQTIRILHEVSKEFSNQEQNFWLKSEKAKNILLADVAKMSLEYQSQLENQIKFNDGAIQMMAAQLKQLLESDGRGKVEEIATPSPRHTAVKVISAVQILMRELNQEGNYLVISSSSLQNEEERKRWENILKLPKYSHHFFVVVCDDEASVSSYENLITDGDHADDNNFILIVSRDGPVAGIIDEINYTELSKDFQESILTKTISFQGETLTVGDLVGEKPEEVIDFSSLNQLLLEKKQVKIPSYDTSRFEESLYINRRVKTPFDNHFEDELAKRIGCTSAELRKECRISLPDGNIEWLVEEKRQKEIWDKMKNGADKTTPSGIIAEDNQLISFEIKGRSIVIISGVAGTGKSTLLSHFYKEIKTKKPDYWVIKINLVDRSEAIMKWYDGKQTNAADFFVNYLHEIGNKDSFTNSLLRHRLEKGDRIAIMFDGFDEIDARCQNSAIQLMKAISKNKSIQLYVTTRPHSVGDLQNELFQFSYTLEIFDINNQISYLTQYWEKKLNTEEDIQDKSIIRKFAESLTDRVSQTLRDQERSFIGIPLQCRILAECFQQELQTILKRNNQTDFENQLFENVNFDLNSLYKLLMKTKRRVFREEKVKAPVPNQITDYAIDYLIEKIESHLTKLAIETLVTDTKSSDILWPPQLSYHQLKTDKMQEENMITEFGVKFGLIMYKDEAIKTQFLHRTFAEYLLAKYLYRGIAVNHCENNYLLDNEQVRDLIINKILGERNFDGVRIFFDSMLKKTVNSTAWHVISEGKQILPSQLQNFTNDLAIHIGKPQDTYNTYDYCPNLLGNTVYERNENLFDFLCDCLDIVLDKNEVRQVFRSAFEKSSFRFESFYFVNSGLFQRFTKYYDDADYLELNCIMHKMLFDMTSPIAYFISLQALKIYNNIWNTTEAKKVVKQVVKIQLDLIEQNRTVFMKEVMSPGVQHGDPMFELLHFFIFNEYYDSLFDQFFRLLSWCLDDCAFTNLLQNILMMRNELNNYWAYPLNSGIEKAPIIMNILRDLGRHKVIEGLSHLTLAWDKTFFETFYQPCRSKEEENRSDLQLLLKNRDSSRMTLLHRAAFYGDSQTVDDILETIRKSISSSTNHLVELVVKDIMLARNDECFTPFYVAAASGHKEICVQILFFLKKILGRDQIEKCLIANEKFLHRAMWVAIQLKNDSMFKVILEGVNQALGQENLLVLLKSSETERLPKYDKVLIKIISQVLLQNGSENGYEGLNNLILRDRECDPLYYSRADICNTLEEVEDETLQGMLTVKGMENWTQRFLEYEIYFGSCDCDCDCESDCDCDCESDCEGEFFKPPFDEDFVKLIHLLARFTRNQRSQFVDAITSPHTPITRFYPVKISYWAKWFVGDDCIHDMDLDCLEKLLEIIAENQDNETTDIQKLLFSDDGKDITRALLCQNRKIVSIMFNHLSEMEKLQITKDIKRNGPEIIDEMSHYLRTDENSSQIFRYWVNILPFYNDGDEGNRQFEKLIEILLLLRTEKHRTEKHRTGKHRLSRLMATEKIITEKELQYSFWSRYLDSYDDTDGNKIEMVGQFLNCVSEKLGKEAVKKVVLHEDCKGIVLLGAELQENKQLVNVMLTHLNDQDRDCIDLLISTNCPFNSRRYRSARSVEPCQCKPMNSCRCWDLTLWTLTRRSSVPTL